MHIVCKPLYQIYLDLNFSLKSVSGQSYINLVIKYIPTYLNRVRVIKTFVSNLFLHIRIALYKPWYQIACSVRVISCHVSDTWTTYLHIQQSYKILGIKYISTNLDKVIKTLISTIFISGIEFDISIWTEIYKPWYQIYFYIPG